MPSKLSDPLFHSQHAKAARFDRIETAAIVFNAQK